MTHHESALYKSEEELAKINEASVKLALLLKDSGKSWLKESVFSCLQK